SAQERRLQCGAWLPWPAEDRVVWFALWRSPAVCRRYNPIALSHRLPVKLVGRQRAHSQLVVPNLQVMFSWHASQAAHWDLAGHDLLEIPKDRRYTKIGPHIPGKLNS